MTAELVSITTTFGLKCKSDSQIARSNESMSIESKSKSYSNSVLLRISSNKFTLPASLETIARIGVIFGNSEQVLCSTANLSSLPSIYTAANRAIPRVRRYYSGAFHAKLQAQFIERTPTNSFEYFKNYTFFSILAVPIIQIRRKRCIVKIISLSCRCRVLIPYELYQKLETWILGFAKSLCTLLPLLI